MPLAARWKVSLAAVLAALGLAFVGGAVGLWLYASSADSAPPSARVESSEIAGYAERRAVLDTYLTGKPYAPPRPSAPADSALVFGLFYQNNGGVVPGPSDWSIRVLTRVPPDSLDVWVGELAPSDSVDTRWLASLPPGPPRDGLTEWYGDAFRSVGVDRRRGIVAFRSSTMAYAPAGE